MDSAAKVAFARCQLSNISAQPLRWRESPPQGLRSTRPGKSSERARRKSRGVSALSDDEGAECGRRRNIEPNAARKPVSDEHWWRFALRRRERTKLRPAVRFQRTAIEQL